MGNRRMGLGRMEALLEQIDRDLNLTNSTLTAPTIVNAVSIDCAGALVVDTTSTLTGVVTMAAAPLLTGIQRHAADTILTVSDTTSLLIFAHATGGNRVITLPAATVGRHVRIFWEITQATTNRVLTAAGTDDITGQIHTSVTGNVAGDGDIVSVTAGTVAITVVDDVLLGSELNLYCGVAGTWLVNGNLFLDDVGSVPTIA
jgi:hypothetical protein